MSKPYNTTELDPDTAFERHVYHRDQFAHYLRWTHVLKLANIGMKILDFGCGSGNMYEVFYRNRFKPARFLGLDVRKQTIAKDKEKFPQVEWAVADLAAPIDETWPDAGQSTDWDIITSFEVAEHVGKWKVPQFLDNIKIHCNPNTIILISTPCYDAKVGAADNHTYDAGDGRGVAPQELTYQEMKELLSERFEIIEHYGTFASQKDYKDKLSEKGKEMFDRLSRYYDSNLVAVIFAPLVPQYSRNVLWKCKLKKV